MARWVLPAMSKAMTTLAIRAPRSTSTSTRIAASGPSCRPRRRSPASASMPTGRPAIAIARLPEVRKRYGLPVHVWVRSFALTTTADVTAGARSVRLARRGRRRHRGLGLPLGRLLLPGQRRATAGLERDHGDDRAPQRSQGGLRRLNHRLLSRRSELTGLLHGDADPRPDSDGVSPGPRQRANPVQVKMICTRKMTQLFSSIQRVEQLCDSSMDLVFSGPEAGETVLDLRR